MPHRVLIGQCKRKRTLLGARQLLLQCVGSPQLNRLLKLTADGLHVRLGLPHAIDQLAELLLLTQFVERDFVPLDAQDRVGKFVGVMFE